MRSMSIPKTAAKTSARTKAPQYGTPPFIIRVKAMKVPNMAISPWAKFTTSDVLKMSTSPSAARA